MHFLGLDIGTSSTKALVCDELGRIVADASVPHPIAQPQSGWSEQDPADWWRSTVQAIRTVLQMPAVRTEEIVSVGLSGQMHGSVLLGADAAPSGGRSDVLRPAILWNDQRTAAQCAAIESALGGRSAMVEAVANAALPGFTLPKLLWVREHEPDVWNRTRTVLLPKDFIGFRLTGVLATDVGDASGTLLFDVDRREWSPPMLDRFGIDADLLPPVFESARRIGTVSPWAAEQTGLRAAIPVAAGSGDNMTAAVGAGVAAPGLVLGVLGTSGVIYAHVNQPRKDLADPNAPGRLHTMAAATGPAGWCVTGCMLSAAGALDWCRRAIAPTSSFDELLGEAEAAPPGCEGLVFLPYLTGERCPYPDPVARGGWIGLTSRHTRGHLVRAVVEGVTFGMAQILDLARSLGIAVDAVRVSGGGNRSAFWRQLQADVYRCPIETTTTEDGGSALGAAILGAVAVGAFPSVAAACQHMIATNDAMAAEDSPDPRLRRAAEVYRSLYAELAPSFPSLAAIG